ncbi:MAG: AIR synthase-related protein, partial [Candidatus Ranarchaeia archaeon]
YRDPYYGTQGVVLESLANLATIGMEPIAMVDCCNFGDPTVPEAFWQFKESIKGMSAILKDLEIPCVGGNVSLYNGDEVTNQAIKPTPVVMVLGLLEKIQTPPGSGFKNSGDRVYLIGETRDEMGGSELYANVFDSLAGITPTIELKNAINQISTVRNAVASSLVSSAHDVGKGGIGVALAEMAILGSLGCDVDLSAIPSPSDLPIRKLLFSETYGRFIVTINQKDIKDFERLLLESNISFKAIGETTDISFIKIKYNDETVSVQLEDAKNAWERYIPKHLGEK